MNLRKSPRRNLTRTPGLKKTTTSQRVRTAPAYRTRPRSRQPKPPPLTRRTKSPWLPAAMTRKSRRGRDWWWRSWSVQHGASTCASSASLTVVVPSIVTLKGGGRHAKHRNIYLDVDVRSSTRFLRNAWPEFNWECITLVNDHAVAPARDESRKSSGHPVRFVDVKVSRVRRPCDLVSWLVD